MFSSFAFARANSKRFPCSIMTPLTGARMNDTFLQDKKAKEARRGLMKEESRWMVPESLACFLARCKGAPLPLADLNRFPASHPRCLPALHLGCPLSSFGACSARETRGEEGTRSEKSVAAAGVAVESGPGESGAAGREDR